MKCQKVKKESLAAARQQEIIRACEELFLDRRHQGGYGPGGTAGTGSLLQEYCRDGGSSSQAAETDGSPLYHHREELLPGKADGF